ncbi:MAG: hypothetical protein ACFCUQ_15285 [Kiloniellales bacterium]
MSSQRLTRRRMVTAGLGLAALSTIPSRMTPLSAAAALVPTPRQTEGPFYPESLPLDHDNDLLQVEGQERQAAGTPLHLFGRVLTESARPLAGLRVEIWQCDAFGHYHHPRDRGSADPAFQGYGQTVTAADGAYRFRTIRPVAYPGRTPHIHFAISGSGIERLVTQMYVAGEPQNERDWILGRIRDQAARESVIVALAPAPELGPAAPESGSLTGTFDIVLGRTLLDG